MLEPINRVAGELQGTTRFMLTDVIGLMILLQVGLAVTGRALAGATCATKRWRCTGCCWG